MDTSHKYTPEEARKQAAAFAAHTQAEHWREVDAAEKDAEGRWKWVPGKAEK